MITSRDELREYIIADRNARFKDKDSVVTVFKAGEMWHYNVVLRHLEYHLSRYGCGHRILAFVLKVLLRHYMIKTGWTVPPFTCGKGLCIVHRGTVVINPKTRIGENLRCHVCVNIGANEAGESPIIGDNVYIGPGAKIFGKIIIGSNNKIGANAVVNKSFVDENVSLAGVPARIVNINKNE